MHHAWFVEGVGHLGRRSRAWLLHRRHGFGPRAQERQAEALGALASRYVAAQTELDERAPVRTVAGLSLIEVEVDRFQGNILRATGVANTYLVRTAEGNLLFDTGLATQAAKHKRLLYPFMPEAPPEGGFAAYGGVQPDVLVADGAAHSFTLGGVRFEALPAPGAEGEDNLVLWLPQQRALFSGDFFGPLFPMTPNLFTLRGEKFRDPTAYVASLDRLIALRPQIILPSHFDPILGEERLAAAMRAMRDATAYIHDQTIAGMNAGKSLWALMREIKLPPALALSQGHGMPPPAAKLPLDMMHGEGGRLIYDCTPRPWLLGACLWND